MKKAATGSETGFAIRLNQQVEKHGMQRRCSGRGCSTSCTGLFMVFFTTGSQRLPYLPHFPNVCMERFLTLPLRSWCLYIGTLTAWAFHHFGAESSGLRPRCDHSGPENVRELKQGSRHKMNHLVATMVSVTPANMNRIMGKCCTHGLTLEMAKYLMKL
jgi:hypothetical protein